MDKHEATYSGIVGAADYNRMMTTEHLYIAEADQALEKIVRRYSQGNPQPAEVLEIGSGPVRCTPLLAGLPDVRVTALDYDLGWIEAGRQIMVEQRWEADLVCADIETYQHPKPVDIAVSQGSHHHIQKWKATKRYLENVRRQLAPSGIFVISDEVIPHYLTEEERCVRLCIWYAHIISNALLRGYMQLAITEMQTLLDDLFEGLGSRAIKDEVQMALVQKYVHPIAGLAEADALKGAERVSEHLLRDIWDSQSRSTTNEAPLSRGDYKVCFSVFRQEVEQAGFRIREAKTIGPIETIGGFGIYTLEAAT